MADAAQVKQLQWDEQARELMRASADASPWSLVEGFENNLANAHLWEVEQGAARVLFAFRGLELQNGRLLEVVGMRSLGERARAADFEPVIDRLAREVYAADLLSMCTRRDHIARACERQGWTRVGSIVNKPLRVM